MVEANVNLDDPALKRWLDSMIKERTKYVYERSSIFNYADKIMRTVYDEKARSNCRS